MSWAAKRGMLTWIPVLLWCMYVLGLDHWAMVAHDMCVTLAIWLCVLASMVQLCALVSLVMSVTSNWGVFTQSWVPTIRGKWHAWRSDYSMWSEAMLFNQCKQSWMNCQCMLLPHHWQINNLNNYQQKQYITTHWEMCCDALFVLVVV